jgi:hypothetical protein
MRIGIVRVAVFAARAAGLDLPELGGKQAIGCA